MISAQELVEAEHCVLAGLLPPSLLDPAVIGAQPLFFADPVHGAICRSIGLYPRDGSGTPTLTMLAEVLGDAIKDRGGLEYLERLAHAAPRWMKRAQLPPLCRTPGRGAPSPKWHFERTRRLSRLTRTRSA